MALKGQIVIENLSSDPTTGLVTGQLYFNTTDNVLRFYDGTAWQDIGASAPLVTSNLLVHLDAGDSASYSGSGTTWTDLTGNGYNGTLTNGPTYDSANSGSISLDGADDYVKINSVAGTGTSNQSQSYEVWINPSDANGNVFYISDQSGGGNWNMPPIRASNGVFQGKIWNNAFLSSSAYTQGNWYQVVLVFNASAGTGELYVNGSSVASQSSISYSSSNASNYFFLGAQNVGSDGTGYLTAKYGIFRIYMKALSASEVSQNWDHNRGRYGL